MSAKILVLDIETMANEGYFWHNRDVTIPIEMIKHNEYMLCWCAKWVGKAEVLSDSIHNYPREFKRNKRSDRMIAKSLHKLMDEADIIITHNGNRFDLKWANELFLRHNLGPVSSYHSIDTLVQTNANFRTVSASLQYRLKKLGIGEKLKHEGWGMWIKFASGNRRTKMIQYCKEDVRKTEQYYLLIRPFIKSHPNVALYDTDIDFKCPNCGSTDLKKYGIATTNTNKFQRYKCKSCKKETRGRTSLLSKEERKTLRG